MILRAGLFLAGLGLFSWRMVCSAKLSLESYSSPVPPPEMADSCAGVVSPCGGLGSTHCRRSPALALWPGVEVVLDRSLLKTETWGCLEATEKVQQSRSWRWKRIKLEAGKKIWSRRYRRGVETRRGKEQVGGVEGRAGGFVKLCRAEEARPHAAALPVGRTSPLLQASERRSGWIHVFLILLKGRKR